MDFTFKLSAIKMRKDMHISVLNNQSNTYMQHAPVVAPVVVAPVVVAPVVVAPVVAPVVVAPVVAPVVATNNKLPKKGFNVVLSKIKQ